MSTPSKNETPSFRKTQTYESSILNGSCATLATGGSAYRQMITCRLFNNGFNIVLHVSETQAHPLYRKCLTALFYSLSRINNRSLSAHRPDQPPPSLNIASPSQAAHSRSSVSNPVSPNGQPPSSGSASTHGASQARYPPLGSPTSFHDLTPSNYAPAHESRRRNAEQRAATLRADHLIGEVEPNRVFCSLCQKWVQLRQDSSYCAYPWLQHRGKCLARQ